MDYVRTEPLRWRDFPFKEISYAEENKFAVDTPYSQMADTREKTGA